MQKYDLLIRQGLVFDGTGAPPSVMDIAVHNGRVAELQNQIDSASFNRVIEAKGKWVMPGLLDIHTHLDLEVEVDPTLSESLRHGTTTVLVGNCSLGTCFGTQRKENQDPIIDCFARVENMPKKVLQKCADNITWDNTADYLQHLDNLPLGINIAAFVPHSMLRIEAMGLEAAVSRDPTEDELIAMERLLEQAMEQGYLGLSTDGLPFHYLANDPNTKKRIPTQHAKFFELKRLLRIVRNYDRTWQTTPIIENKVKGLAYFFLSCGRLFGRTLKTTGLSVMEFVLAPRASNLFLGISKLINSKALQGNIHFQALGCNFRVWCDGPVSPLFEELESVSELIALEHDDIEGRRKLLDDPAWIESFRAEWFHGRRGWNLAHLKAKLGLPEILVVRDLSLMIFDKAPLAEWNEETLHAVYTRAQRFSQGDDSVARSSNEREALAKVPKLEDESDFMRHLFREYDKQCRFYVDVANKNDRPAMRYLLNENTLPGFNDSGAHITNMAFYDGNLMSLKLAQEIDLLTVSKMVERLTSKPARFFGLDVGRLSAGAKADIAIIDPAALKDFNSNDHRIVAWRKEYEHHQMLNRPPKVVTEVIVSGHVAWEADSPTEVLGNVRLGEYLRAA